MDLSILSDEQQYAYELFTCGKNICITGPGGTGKTKLIEYFVNYSKSIGNSIQVCAMTGCATVLLPKICNARTLHSWSGIRLCKGDKKQIVENVMRNKRNKANWKNIKILIIDEISMMSVKILNVLNEIAQTVRYNREPFGGIQLVLLGDFYQLPPVGTIGEPETEQFCFNSKVWTKMFQPDNIVILKTIFRQTDPIYKSILLEIREACLSEQNISILKKYLNRDFDETKYNGCIPTKLFPTRAKTDYLNNLMFSKLDNEKYTFNCEKKVACKTYIESNKPLSMEDLQKCSNLPETIIEFEIQKLIGTSSYPEMLHLKKGANVMCTVNLDIDNGICNGSQGVISDIVETETGILPEVIFINGIKRVLDVHFVQSEEYPCIAVGQIPLCLAWALTIHKIQGTTLSMANIDVGSQIFECGQTYVALSRVQSLDGLYLSAFNPSRIRANKEVKTFYDNIPEKEYKIEKKEKVDENIFSSFELKEEDYVDPTIKKIQLYK